MAESKLGKANEKIAEVVTSGFQKVEDGVVGSYKKVESGVVDTYTRIEDGFVGQFLIKEGETVEDAKARLKHKQ